MNRPEVVRASDLYDLAQCEHRLTLDRRYPRSERTEPDAVTSALLARGIDLEADWAERLNWPMPSYPPGDFLAGATATRELMASGVPGIYQGVLFDGEELAIPDLLERIGETTHYAPGDIKAGFVARADQLLQVAFAAWLLERVQGVRPDYGFLLLGAGNREQFALEPIWPTVRAAIERAHQIARGVERTVPFFDPQCGRCRWRLRCVPELVEQGDLSLVEGMTRARARVLRGVGIDSIAALAAAPTPRSAIPFPTERLQRQAQALHRVRLSENADFVPPAELAHGVLLWGERDPLSAERAGWLAWRHDGTSRIAAPGDRDAQRELIEQLLLLEQPVLQFGAEAQRLLFELGDRLFPSPQWGTALRSRLVDLLPMIRRRFPYLPLRRHTFIEVDAALQGGPLPDPCQPETAAFVIDQPDELRAYFSSRLDRLARLRDSLLRVECG